MNKAYLLWLPAFLLFCSCATNNVAGTGSETDTGCSVAGLIRYGNSMPVIHADVLLHDLRLVKRNTLSKQQAGAGLIRSGYTQTNVNGFFHFDSVDTGGYLVEINDHDTLGAVLPAQVAQGDTLRNVNGTVRKFGTIVGKIDTTGIGKNKIVTIYLPELGRTVPVDSIGNFVIKNLPAWNYQMRLAVQDTIVRLPLDSILVPVKTAETTRITSFGSKSGTVLIDGKIIENPIQ
jgi:hypothetical protein